MTTPTGTISLNDVQTEFGGVNPIGINEYYRGGLYTTTNNTGVPTSGQISMSQLRGLYRTASPAELATAISSTPYASFRNKLFSYVHAGYGFETQSVTAYHTIDPYNINASSITASRTFSTSYVAGALPFLKTSYLTFVAITGGYNAGYSSLTINGVARTMTSIASAGQPPTNAVTMNYGQIVVGENALSGMSISNTFSKTPANVGSIFHVLTFPGRWNLVGAASRLYSTGSGYPTVAGVQANDLLVGIRTLGVDGNENNIGTFSGVGVSEIVRASTQWYSNFTSVTGRATSAGTCVFNTGSSPGTIGTGDQRQNVTFYSGGIFAVFRCVNG